MARMPPTKKAPRAMPTMIRNDFDELVLAGVGAGVGLFSVGALEEGVGAVEEGVGALEEGVGALEEWVGALEEGVGESVEVGAFDDDVGAEDVGDCEVGNGVGLKVVGDSVEVGKLVGTMLGGVVVGADEETGASD